MIVPKQGFKTKYTYGGSGIFTPMANLLTGLAASNVAKQLATSAIDIGKSAAKEGVKKVVTDVGTKLVKKALTPKSKKILQKYTTPIPTKPATQNLSSLIDGSSVEIQNLVERLNQGKGIKKT